MIFLRLFKNNRTLGVAVVFLIALGLFLPSFIRSPELQTFAGMPFFQLVFGPLQQLPALNRILAMVVLLLLCYLLIRISGRFALLEMRSFMPAIFFLLFAVSLPESRQLSPALVGSVFYILCFGSLFDVSDKRPDTLQIFNAGLMLALGSLFYLKLIWFLPVFWFSLATIRNVTWRELVYPVTALVLAGILLFTWYWGIMDTGQNFVTVIRTNLSFVGGFVPRHYSVYVFFGFFLLLITVASIYMINRFQSRKTVVQNIYQALFYMFLGGILFFVFIARFDPAALVYIALPVSFVLTNYFHRRRNPWTHELLMWLLVGGVVFVQVI